MQKLLEIELGNNDINRIFVWQTLFRNLVEVPIRGPIIFLTLDIVEKKHI